jgi:hypothetical protein
MKYRAYALVICVSTLLLAGPTSADVVSLKYASIATCVDEGQQDGICDSFAPYNLGSVTNNGYTSFRTAFEFDLSGLPAGAIVNSATVTMVSSNWEGTRSLQAHGYAGDGTVQLGDCDNVDGLVGTFGVDPSGTQTVILDVTGFVAGLVASGGHFAGFNLREEPPSSGMVIFFDVASTPLLSVDFSAEQIVGIDIKPGGVPNSINRRSEGKIPVAILSSATFDAREVDAASLTFGRTGDEESLAFYSPAPEDVNGDGLPDLICHFNTPATGFLLGDTQGVLKGKTLKGAAIRGMDSVRIVR